MKTKLLLALTGSLILGTSSVLAFTDVNVQSANFLASKGIINNNSGNPLSYNLDNNITRREMLKVMMNLSGKTVSETCTGKFSDVNSSDWGCKYAEAALANGFIAANATFRPGDNITQIESLKMIMQAKGLEKNTNDDWRAGYVSKAQSEKIVAEGYFNYDINALRGWIFDTSASSYADFEVSTQVETELTPEEEELFKYLLEL